MVIEAREEVGLSATCMELDACKGRFARGVGENIHPLELSLGSKDQNMHVADAEGEGEVHKDTVHNMGKDTRQAAVPEVDNTQDMETCNLAVQSIERRRMVAEDVKAPSW